MPLILQPGDRAFIRLHDGYRVAGMGNRKLSEQRVGPFRVIERVGSRAYKLDIPTEWTIHPVINIAMLEPAPSRKDPFERPTPDHPPAVDDERNNNNGAYYTVAQIVGR